MAEGTLIVSRAVKLFPDIQKFYEDLGFKKVTVTATEKDGLNLLIIEKDPEILLMDSRFYEAGTPFMLGEIVKMFPDLYTAAVSGDNYPLGKAIFFYWHGVNSYVNLWEGSAEFNKGLRCVKEKKEYNSPSLLNLIETTDGSPDVDKRITMKQMDCLILLCCGFRVKTIGKNLHITKSTVENYLNSLYEIFHVGNSHEMVSLAWKLELVTKDDMQFYDDRTIKFPLPKWAEERRNINRRLVS